MEKPNPVAITVIVGIVYFLLMMLLARIFFDSAVGLGIVLLFILGLPFVCLLTFIVSCFFQKEWSRDNKYAVAIFFILFLIPCIVSWRAFFSIK